MRSRTPCRRLREALAGGPGARTGSRCKSRAQVARRAGTAGSAGAPGTAGGWRSRGVVRYRGLASGRDGLDGDHLPATASRAAAQRLAGQGLAAVAVVARRLRLGQRLGHGEQAAAQRQLAPPVAVGEEAEMPDAVKAGRQQVEQEAPDELGGGQRHRLEAVRLAVVLEAEAHAPAVEGQEALVGDGDAVRVAAEVVEHAGGPVEGRLGVDHPLAAAQGPQVAREGGRVGKVGEAAAEPQAALAEGLLELVEEERAEAAGEDAHGQEEARAAGDPAVAGGGEAAAGDDAVQVGVVAEAAAPGVQHRQESDLGAQVARVGGDLAQGAGGGAEEQVVERRAVLQGEGGDLGREGEHDVEVGAVQQLAAALGEPGGAVGALALGAVAVAAGAVAAAAVPAAVALLDLAPEGGRAALLEGAHDAPLQAAQGVAAAAPEGLAVAPEDIRDLQGRAAHGALRRSAEASGGRGSRSSGLVAEQTLEQATCR